MNTVIDRRLRPGQALGWFLQSSVNIVRPMRYSIAALLIGLAVTGHTRIITFGVNPPPDGSSQTNSLSISTNEVCSILSFPFLQYPSLSVEVAGTTNQFYADQVFQYPIIIGGSATVRLRSYNRVSAFCTLRIELEAFSPDKTILIPAGGGANIGLECSTNLSPESALVVCGYSRAKAEAFHEIIESTCGVEPWYMADDYKQPVRRRGRSRHDCTS